MLWAMAMSGRFLPVPNTLPGASPTAMRGGCARGRRGCARGSLDAGVHVGLVVVADVEHVVVALEHPGQAPEADVGGAPVAALGHDLDVGPCPCRRRAAATPVATAGRVAEQGVEPGNLPGGFGIGSGENLEATGRVDGDQLAGPWPASPHRARSGHRAPRRSPGRPGGPEVMALERSIEA